MERPYDWPTCDPTWEKWTPSHPASPHWYTPARFQQLLAQHLLEDRRKGGVRTVQELLAGI